MNAAGTAFESLTEYGLTMPVVSVCHAAAGLSLPGQLFLYCMQTQVSTVLRGLQPDACEA